MNKRYYVIRIIFLVILITIFWVFCVKGETQKHTILTKKGGVNYYDDGLGGGPHKETYYNLPMGKICEIAHKKGIKGEYWETEDGLKMYGYFIICAADWDVHPYGSIVLTSHGPGKVLDTGTFKETNPTQVDLAVTW